MSGSAIKTNVEEIARILSTRRDQGQRTVLFLGARAGALFGNKYFYDTLKQFSLLNFDNSYISDTDKFKECYSTLNNSKFSKTERYNILVGALALLSYREEDKILAELVKVGFFEVIVSTNVDTLLEDACNFSGMQEPNDYQVFIPGKHDISEIEQNRPRYTSIIKVFGELESRRYEAVDRSLSLKTPSNLKTFLETQLAKEVLVIGYDPIWDQPLEQAFPATGGTLWYVNEEKASPTSQFALLLDQRNGKLLQYNQRSYAKFLPALSHYLAEDIKREEVAYSQMSQPPDQDTNKVFISYSHRDKEYLERCRVHLKGLLHREPMVIHDNVWDDTEIQVGADWEKEIKAALERTKVAILLISADFFASDFIREKELPLLLQAARRGNVRLLPIIIDSFPIIIDSPTSLDPSMSLFNEKNPLLDYQVINSSSNPLKWMKPYEQEVVWNKLAEQVYDILRSQN